MEPDTCTRFALVIGNSQYASLGHQVEQLPVLREGHHDACGMDDKLAKRGF